jgi:hypothetical protein
MRRCVSEEGHFHHGRDKAADGEGGLDVECGFESGSAGVAHGSGIFWP